VGDAAGALPAAACKRRPVGQRWIGGATKGWFSVVGEEVADPTAGTPSCTPPAVVEREATFVAAGGRRRKRSCLITI
jgi:hypothetical protein